MPPWTVSKGPFPATSYGFVESRTNGINLSGTTTANTKSGYVEITPSVSYDSDGIYLFFFPDALSTMTNSFLIDIAVGSAGSEVPIIENIPATGRRGSGQRVFIPIAIPSGSRISTRSQVLNVGASQRGIGLCATLLPRSYTASNQNRNKVCTTYGANTSDSGGVQVDPGAAANTKGAWSEVVSSTAYPIRQLLLFFNLINNTTASAANFLVDVGIGSNGQEQLLISDISVGEQVGSDGLVPPVFGPIPISIPSGTRIAVRAQCNITDATDRLFDVIVMGVS